MPSGRIGWLSGCCNAPTLFDIERENRSVPISKRTDFGPIFAWTTLIAKNGPVAGTKPWFIGVVGVVRGQLRPVGFLNTEIRKMHQICSVLSRTTLADFFRA